MNIDIRISLGFLDHPKTKKLRKRLGDGAVLCLLRLWMWAAENRPAGLLDNMDAEDVELAADWKGDEGAFTQALIDCRWLEKTDDGCYAIHDWDEHQAYASKSEERHERAKKAAQARWEKPHDANSNAQAMLDDANSISEHATSNAPRHQDSKLLINTPPPPSQGELCASQDDPQEKYPADFEAFWALYPRKEGKHDAVKAWKKNKQKIPKLEKLKAALDWQKTTDQWQRGIIPHATTWLNGHRWQDDQPVPPRYRDPPPPEMSYPDEPPEISEETRQQIAVMKEQLARRKAMA